MKWHNQWAGWRCKAGQAMVEYVVLTGMTLGVLLMLAVFLFAFKEAGGRVLDLIAYEYP
jgi:hypothetical protein